MRNGEIRDMVAESLLRPDDRLVAALDKKLSSLEGMLLRLWVAAERDQAASEEWERHKDRVGG